MDLLFVIGDQDSYHEADSDIVSSPRWVADLLAEEGMPSLFVVQARRAEILAEQGRHDVIAAIRRHEIGLHGRDNHPVLPEIVEGLGWQEGVAAVEGVEREALNTLGRVFDVAPVCSSEHRGFAAPQIFGAVQRLGLPYLFGAPSAPPCCSVSWYAGALNVPFNTPTPEFLGFFPAVFDDVLHDDAAFTTLFQRLNEHIARCLEVDLPLLVVFACHPERLCYTGPLEVWQYGNGRNHDPTSVPAGIERRRSRVEIERALANLQTLVRSLRDTPGLEPTTVASLTRRYGAVSPLLTRAELRATAEQARASRQIVIGPSASAAEIVLGWAESLGHALTRGCLPEHAPRHAVLGPTEAPPLAPDAPHLGLERLAALAERLLTSSTETGHLLASVASGEATLGVSVLYGALAEAYLAATQGGLTTDSIIGLAPWPRYPALALALGEQQRRCGEDLLVRPGLSTEAAALHTRLQTWTLKPATRA